MKKILLSSIFAASVGTLVPVSVQADWLQFRGNDSNGLAEKDATPPTKFDGEKSIAWKVKLPGEGLSCPIVVGEKVFVTCSSGADQNLLHVFCFNAADGSKIWERRFWATGRTMCHKKTSVAAPTPTSDGKNIYALYSSNDLISLDLDGNLNWLRGLTVDYANASNSLGLATSPIMVDGVLVVQIENDADSFAAGIDTKTGKNLWRMPTTKKANWSSPVSIGTGDNALVVIQGSKGLLGVRPDTGSVIWKYEDGASTIPSSVVANEVIYAPSHGLTALQPTDGGGEPKQLWRAEKIRPGTSSPVVAGDKIYAVSSAGILEGAKLDTGESLFRTRLEDRKFSSSPVVAGNYLYVFGERGIGHIVDLTKPEGEVVSTIELEEEILGTPALSGDGIYIRSDGHLWKLASP